MFLSICIPTNGRVEILLNTLDSIYLIDQYYLQYFEVVITDNSTNSDLQNHLNKYYKFGNLKYFISTTIGFTNIIKSLENGSGLLLKLHNNYTKMINPQSIISLIDLIQQQANFKPIIYFTNGQLKNIDLKLYDDFDKFSYDLSFWNTWAMGFSIWKEDFEKYKYGNINTMFPHTSLLMSQGNSKKSFLINNNILFLNQDVPSKGGYDLFKTFCIDYLSLIDQHRTIGNISNRTFCKIKKELFYNFLIPWYYNTKRVKNTFTFEMNNVKSSVTFYYSSYKYYQLLFYSYIYPLYFKVKAIYS